MTTTTETTTETTTGRYAEIARIARRLNQTTTERQGRILNALGHPGYGNQYAAEALDRWAKNPNISLHEAVLGSSAYSPAAK